MIIAVASGKGGTGKTTVATSLALSLRAPTERVVLAALPPLYLDCDVEAPNAHLFLHPLYAQRQGVSIQVPQIDEQNCTHCGTSAEESQYQPIAVLGKKTLVFPQL
jgi:MinD superfamily P-loop ATPase